MRQASRETVVKSIVERALKSCNKAQESEIAREMERPNLE